MGGFKDFLFRGNFIQLAVAVIMGTAFGALVTSFTKGFITPLLGMFGEQPTFAESYFAVLGSKFLYGQFIDALVAFLILAGVLYYAVVYPSEWVMKKFKKEAEATTRDCPECASTMKKKATRCPFCTTPVLAIPPDEPKPSEMKAESPKPEPV